MAKLTTGGFFRALLRHAVYGDNENPLTTVVKAGLTDGKKEVKATGEEAEQKSGHSDHGRIEEALGTEKA